MKLAILLALTLSAVNGEHEIRIKGPESGLFKGDAYKYICTTHGESNSTELIWRYKISSEDEDAIFTRDHIAEDEFDFIDSEQQRQTILRPTINNAIISNLICQQREKETGRSLGQQSMQIDYRANDFHQVHALDEPTCDDTPKIIMRRWSGFESEYWISHYVTNKTVNLESSGALGVSGLKLSCLSKQKVKWIITKTMKNFRYYTNKAGDCHSANLVMTSLNDDNSQKFICGQDKYGSTIQLNYVSSTTREGNNGGEHVIDFNKTQECIEHLGTTFFESKTLTWATGGTSLMSLAMMFGIVFLKKQLDKQKEINASNASPTEDANNENNNNNNGERKQSASGPQLA